MKNVLNIFISFVFLSLYSFSIASAAKVKWCIVHNNTGQVSTCFSNKIQCDQMTRNGENPHYSCVAM